MKTIQTRRLVAILKARQLGLTWLCIGYALWLMRFRPGSTVLLFSRRDDEAQELLDRLRQMHARLSGWLQASVGADNSHELQFAALGSVARALPTTKHSGRSFTATLVIVDEADFIPWIRQLVAAVKPTVDAGGRLVLLSTANKETPQSEFKRIWREAREAAAGGADDNYAAVFLPWTARPDRDAAWYAAQLAAYDADTLYQEYPATPGQALAPRANAARFPIEWLDRCFQDSKGLSADGVDLSLPGLTVYTLPAPGREYVIGADPAEGDPHSDASAATVLGRASTLVGGCASTIEGAAASCEDASSQRFGRWEEVAHLSGQFEPTAFASYLSQLAAYYNAAVICCERNNHGHAVHVALRSLDAAACSVPAVYKNPNDGKDGWLSNAKYKTLAVDNAAQVLRDGACLIHSRPSYAELSLFNAATLAAPPGEHDDRAMSFIIALAALRWPSSGSHPASTLVVPTVPTEPWDLTSPFA